MIRQLRSELRKLFTVRSTYVILLICLAITILAAFYANGYHVVAPIRDPGFLASQVTGAVQFLSFIIAIAGILLVTHEYRYNTIMYTLTASRSRLKVLLAKLLVASLFITLAILLFATLSPLLANAGLHLQGTTMVPQSIPYKDLLWRCAFYGWGYGMLALIIAFIIRNQIGAIVTLIFFPGTVEAILGLLLKQNSKYLPFHALDGVLGNGQFMSATLSHGNSALMALAYIVVGLIVSAYLFQKRDAQ